MVVFIGVLGVDRNSSGVDCDGGAELSNGVVELALLAQCVSEIVVCTGVLGVDRNSSAELGNRVVAEPIYVLPSRGG
jgi:hypothetical protein